jgi:hypothetical protein
MSANFASNARTRASAYVSCSFLYNEGKVFFGRVNIEGAGRSRFVVAASIARRKIFDKDVK